MASFTAGTTFVDGVSNDVTAAKLGALVTNATPTSGFIQDRTAETVVGVDDTLLIGDASDSNNLKRMTVANILKAPLVSTSGTIDNLTTGTTTSTAQIVTSGTITTALIPALTTGTTTSTNQVVTNGTITNLSATTSTFLGTITGSTNVINIGSGQIYKDASGQVGIGTSTLAGKLHVKVTTNQNFVTQGSVQIAGSVALSAVNDAVTENVPLEFRYKTNLGFFDNGTESMRIASGGNVGIGTTTPYSKLDIFSSITNGNTGEATGVGSLRITNGASALSSDGGLEFKIAGDSNGYGAKIQALNSSGIQLAFANRSATGTWSERMRINSSGNVGIGTTSPAEALHVSVAGGNNFAGIRSQNNNAGTGIGGIEFSSDATYSKAAIGLLRENVNGVGNIVFYNSSSTGAADWSTSDERMRISSSGNVGIGTTGPTATLHSVSASASTAAGIFQVTATSATSLSAVSVIKQDALNTTNQNFVLFQVGGGTSCGKINANGANTAAFGSTSDARLKENITALPSQIDNICALRPCEFDYKDGSGHQIGFIAQEMQEVYPDAIGVGDDGMLTITAWSKTEARLVKAIQELKAKNDSLEARLEALEAK